MTSDTTLGPAMTGWIARRWRRDEISYKTRSNHTVHTRSFINYVGFGVDVDEVTTDDVEEWLEVGLVDLQPVSRKTYLSTINVFYRWALAPGRGLATRNPCEDVYKIRVPRTAIRRVPPHQATAVVGSAPPRERTQILLALHLGLRCAEVAAMHVEDWDRDAGLLLVHGKGAKERTLPVLNPELIDALTEWVEGLGVEAGPMWPNPTGGPLSYGHVGDSMTKAAAAGLHITPHQWRHTMAATAAARGMPVHILREWLGHESLASTTVYTRAVASELKAWASTGAYLPAAATG